MRVLGAMLFAAVILCGFGECTPRERRQAGADAAQGATVGGAIGGPAGAILGAILTAAAAYIIRRIDKPRVERQAEERGRRDAALTMAHKAQQMTNPQESGEYRVR